MKRFLALFSFIVLGAAIGAGVLRVHAQGGPPSPERQAAIAKQLALEAATPKLEIKEEILPLTIPDHTIGETEGVSMNSKGHLFVYSRTGKGGSSRGGTAAELFEFDQNIQVRQAVGAGQLRRVVRALGPRRQVRQRVDRRRGVRRWSSRWIRTASSR